MGNVQTAMIVAGQFIADWRVLSFKVLCTTAIIGWLSVIVCPVSMQVACGLLSIQLALASLIIVHSHIKRSQHQHR